MTVPTKTDRPSREFGGLLHRGIEKQKHPSPVWMAIGETRSAVRKSSREFIAMSLDTEAAERVPGGPR